MAGIICTIGAGMMRTMSKDQEKFERMERAGRLKEARVSSGLGGVIKVSQRFGWNPNNYKAHESGQNGFGTADGRKYAKAFGVNYQWLYLGLGAANDPEIDNAPTVSSVPFITWVSAGQLDGNTQIDGWEELKMIPAIDLPDGDWIALRVEGDSMNKISPPDSVIFVNRRERKLVPNACYVIANEAGEATYKRYRPNDDPPFQPASYHSIAPPELSGAVRVIGRVRRSTIEM